jgi:hypothetical protein
MTDKICGIIKRAFYLFSGILAITCFFVGAVGIILYGLDSEFTSWIVTGVLVIPVAYMVHRATRWVFFG